MRYALPILSLFAAPALADVNYGVYACDGPTLIQYEQTWLTPDELEQKYPDLPEPGRFEFLIFIEDGTARWTEATRDELDAHCLDLYDRMMAPLAGHWVSSGVTMTRGSCAPQDLEAPLHLYRETLEFGEKFTPNDLFGRSPTGWQITRDPDFNDWHVRAEPPNELPFVKQLNYYIEVTDNDQIAVNGVFVDQANCRAEFRFTLNLRP